ncbi:MAG: hypothetical protein MJ063_00760 [Lachnospiraceae bacterium]|nr:hypothetical protein [Lachnospiraceae bacterium]
MKPYLHELLAALGALKKDERKKIMGAASALSRNTLPKNLLEKYQTALNSLFPELDWDGYIFLSDATYNYDADRNALAVVVISVPPGFADVEMDDGFAEDTVKKVQTLLDKYSEEERAKIASAWWVIDWGEGLDDETRGLYLGNLLNGAKTVSPIRLDLYGGGMVFADVVENKILEKSWETEDDEE